MDNSREMSGLPPAGITEQPPLDPLLLPLPLVAASTVAADKGRLATPVTATVIAPFVAG